MNSSPTGQLASVGRLLHAFDQRGAFGRLAVRLHVAVAIGVDEAEFERVHADQPRQLVHLHLEREIADRDAEAAHGARTACGWCRRNRQSIQTFGMV